MAEKERRRGLIHPLNVQARFIIGRLVYNLRELYAVSAKLLCLLNAQLYSINLEASLDKSC